MVEPVKPVSRASKTAKAKEVQQIQAQPKSKTVEIGGVTFNRDQIDESKTKTYVQNGKNMNSVFVKPGVQINYPDQKNPKNKPSVESTGLKPEWYNPDESWINIQDLEGATITGAKNRDDHIQLGGNSNNNTVIVDNKESWYISNRMRQDKVSLSDETHNNTVRMDESDELQIEFHPVMGSFLFGGREYQVPNSITVQGKGTSEQELQLKESLGEADYNIHKAVQKRDNEK